MALFDIPRGSHAPHRTRWFATLSGLVFASTPIVAQQQARRPNVVLIITDDVGYGDFGGYGAPDVKTPNIDRLAREGVQAHGLLRERTELHADARGSHLRPIPAAVRARTAARRSRQRRQRRRACRSPANRCRNCSKNNGYATGLVGKWHLGYKPQFSPNAHGFDYFFGFKSGFTDYYQHTDGAGDGAICSRTSSRCTCPAT